MRRRTLLATALATPLVRAAHAQPQLNSVLRFVPAADLPSPDPHFSASPQTRDHALLVFDTLFGRDAAGRAQMQMLDSYAVSQNALEWRLRLRTGVFFHSFERVLARDCIASIRRWGARDLHGQALLAVTESLTAIDDRSILFRLKSPFPMLPEVLGKSTPRLCAILPARLAATPPDQEISEIIGSGPFSWQADERKPGERCVYLRHVPYIPNRSPSEATSGAKEAFIQRIEWTVMTDADAEAALRKGAIDWWAAPPAAALAGLAAVPAIRLPRLAPGGAMATLRINPRLPPFDNPETRHALRAAIRQADYMTALNGSTGIIPWRDNVGIFTPDTPMANQAGMAPRPGARAAAGQTITLLASAADKALADVTTSVLAGLGIATRLATADTAKDGWNLAHTSYDGAEMTDPIGHPLLGTPIFQTLRTTWLQAPDRAWQRRIAEQIQRTALDDVTYIPLGQSFPPTAIRTSIKGMLEGMPIFWNLRRGRD